MAISGTGTWSYSFDAGNRLTSTTNPNSETTSFTLDAAGRCTRQDFSNTTYALNSYDSANRITEIQTKNSGATVLSDLQYAYDGVNLTSRTDTDGTVTSFGFDASNQLTSESRDNSHSTGYSISYVYDHNQNRTSKTIGGVTDTYSYDSHDKLTSTSFKSYYYDAGGNCTSVVVGGNTTALTWDGGSILTEKQGSTTTAVYTYGEGLIREESEVTLFDVRPAEIFVDRPTLSPARGPGEIFRAPGGLLCGAPAPNRLRGSRRTAYRCGH